MGLAWIKSIECTFLQRLAIWLILCLFLILSSNFKFQLKWFKQTTMYQIKFQRQSVTSCPQSDGNGIDFYNENNNTPSPNTHTHPTQPNKKIPATININVEHLDDIFFHLSVFSLLSYLDGFLSHASQHCSHTIGYISQLYQM